MKALLKTKWIRFLALIFIFLSCGAILSTILINKNIQKQSRPYIFNNHRSQMPNCYTVMVLGASVHRNGDLSTILNDRVDRAIELYKSGKAKRFLLSGDHGRTDYDEVNTMKKYLINKGIDSCDIFLDHAGFDTYSSMVRAKELFKVDSLYIVTQQYHLYRAVYIARKIGLNAYGYAADKRPYPGILKFTIREWLASVKSWIRVKTKHKPMYLGDPIPITRDSKASWD